MKRLTWQYHIISIEGVVFAKMNTIVTPFLTLAGNCLSYMNSRWVSEKDPYIPLLFSVSFSWNIMLLLRHWRCMITRSSRRIHNFLKNKYKNRNVTIFHDILQVILNPAWSLSDLPYSKLFVYFPVHDDVIKWKHFPRHRPLWGEFTGHRWIPLTMASDAELWFFLWSAPEETLEWIIVRLVIWDAIALIMTSL